MQAAAKARASSSVLRPVEARCTPVADCCVNVNDSIRSSTSMDHKTSKEMKPKKKPSPLASKEDFESVTSTASCLSSPIHIHEPVALNLELSRDGRIPFVVWDQEAGRYISSILACSRAETSMQGPARNSHVSSFKNPSEETSNHGRRLNVPSSSVAAPVLQPGDNTRGNDGHSRLTRNQNGNASVPYQQRRKHF